MQSDVTSFASLAPAYPELILAVGAVVLLLISLFWKGVRSGVIAGYGVRLSPDYERGLVRAHVLLTVTPKLADKVVRSLKALPAVRTLHSVSGSFDMIVIVESPSIGDLDALIDRIGAMEGVERTLSSIILSTRIDR